ncbi:MAG: LamG domain-containing protein [Thermoanaerobaculia bacterium]
MRCRLRVRAIISDKALWLFALALLAGLRSAASPMPSVYFKTAPPPPDVPSEVLIGEQLKFKVRFKQPNTATTGYGPFVDLVLDTGGADIKKLCPNCDGIKFVKAEMIDVGGGPIALNSFTVSAPCVPAPATITLPHPFAASGLAPVTIPAGAELVTIELPFGSFTPPQPDVVLEITASVSSLADDGVPLNISARGGFRYGADALDNPSTDPPVLSDASPNSAAWNAQAQTIPRVMILKKEYLGPEDEAATGPNFIGLYPLQYKLTVDIAAGQTVNNLVLTDCLPPAMAFHQLGAVTPATTAVTLPVIDAPALHNCLTVTWPSLTGATGPDATVFFQFFIPMVDANGIPIPPANCTPALVNNDVKAEGDWTQTPHDPCDTSPLHVVSDVTPVDHTLHAKCLAIQKEVSNATHPGAGPVPGDTLRYELNFQFSDFKTFSGIQIRDVLSDGQLFLLAPAPTLKVADKFAPPGLTGTFSLGPFLSTQLNPFVSCLGVTGGTLINFNVSGRMGTLVGAPPRYLAGILTGGLASAPPSTTPATGQIVFFARVQDQFVFPHPPGDKFVDKDDPLNDCVTISGKVRTNVNPPLMPQPTAFSAQDDSKTATAVVTDTIKKTVYAVRRGLGFLCGPSGPPCASPQDVRPGDAVTFRIEKTIPSSDAELLTVQDFLPLPVFSVAGIAFTNAACGIPAAGAACLGPTDTLHTLVAPKPIVTAPPATNSVKFDYSNFNDPLNQPRKIDLLLTSTVTNQPFADGLFLTNQAQECEDNTFGIHFCQSAIAQVNVREPKLSIKKGVVATDDPQGVFTPALVPPGIWKPFGTSCPRFTPNVNSGNLGGLINSDLSNVDANDSVTFAIAVENTGGAPAYDVDLADTIPLDPLDAPSCFNVTSAFCIRRGNGTAIPFTTAIGGHGRTIIHLGAPLAPGSPFNAAGTNIVIITFNAQLLPNIKPGCCSNRADLLHYSSQPGGPDFVGAGFTPPFSDNATVCVGPKALAKCIVQTSEPHTAPQNSGGGTPPVAVGEIIRYRLIAAVPEGVSPNFQIKDLLPVGLTYLGNPKIGFVSTNPASFTSSTLAGPGLHFAGNEHTVRCVPHPTPALTFSLPPGAVTVLAGSGGDVTFSLGTLTNGDNDADLELVVIEFNALVNNIPSNVNGTVLTNKFEIDVDGQAFDQNNSISVSAVVVEPSLAVNKSVSPIDPAGLNTFTVTVTNTGTADAFDVQLTDSLPPGLNLFGTPTVSVAPPGCATPALNVTTTAGVTTLTVGAPRLPVSPSCTLTLVFKAHAATQCFTNVVQAVYTSLPGNQPGPVGTHPNATGSVTPCLLSNHQDCERVYNASAQAGVTIGCSPPCATQPPNMVSWWPLNEPVGATVVVDVKSGRNGTPLPGGSLAASNVQPGKVAGAEYFTANHVGVPDHPSLRFGTSNLSIDAWLGIINPKQAAGIVDKLDPTAKRGYAFYVSNRFLNFVMGNGTAFTTYTSTAQVNLVNSALTWHHLAVTVDRSSGAGTFYIDGAAAGTFVPLPASTDISSTTALQIGGSRLTFPSCVCEYRLDEIEIFNGVLSAGDVKAIFDAGATGKCP